LGEEPEKAGPRPVPFIEQGWILKQRFKHGAHIGVTRGLVSSQRAGISTQQRQVFGNDL